MFLFLQNILAALVGCATISPGDVAYLMCSSTENLKNIEYMPQVQMISVFDKSRDILSKEHLINVPNLKNLNLNSAINGIEDGALYGLEHLISFYCEDCDIPIIKVNFFNNPNLIIITFQNSNVHDIEKGVFSQKIQTVSLDNNQISVIRKGVFSSTNIRTLYLKSNKIEIIEDGAFSNMENLNHIELHHNLLKEFDSSKLFNKILSLSVLNLADNKLTELNKNTISAFPGLKYFNASYNDIETIETNIFSDFKYLSTIALSNNKIKELKPDIIDENSNLTYLFLHDNDLSYISNELLVKLPKLTAVTIGGNPWKCACQNDLISYMKKHFIRDECVNIDKMKCSSNDSCKYIIEPSQKKYVSNEDCYVTWWNYYYY